MFNHSLPKFRVSNIVVSCLKLFSIIPNNRKCSFAETNGTITRKARARKIILKGTDEEVLLREEHKCEAVRLAH